MAGRFYKVIRGSFLIEGKEPDGDSVRFLADDVTHYDDLLSRGRIIPSQTDTSVQLRLEGIDAPELHYGGSAQPMSPACRDALLAGLGFQRITYRKERPNMVAASEPGRAPGAILSQATDAHGRPICYVLSGAAAASLPSREWIDVGGSLLEQTMNAKLLAAGHSYVLLYRSTPIDHRNALREIARGARTEKRGVWAIDATREFVLGGRESLEMNGQLILPKLFRRCIDYLKDASFRGNLTDWLVWTSKTSRDENDVVEVNGGPPIRLSELLSQRNNKIAVLADIFDLTFFEKDVRPVGPT